MYLFCAPTGSKLWRLAYRVNGKAQTATFGPYPEVSLAEARSKRDAFKRDLRNGTLPTKRTRSIALSDAITQYWDGRMDLSESYRSNAKRGLEMHLTKLLDTQVSDIAREMLLDELRRMDAKKLYVYVRKVRRWAGQVFDWCQDHGYMQTNPARDIRPQTFSTAPVEHFAALELSEVPEFMARLSMESDLQSVLACKLLALTWVRTNELRMMEWSEIDGDLWRIPAGKMKRRRDHVVPLSRQSVDILEQLKQRAGGCYVFSHPYRSDRPMSENSILYLLYRIGYKGRLTGHGFRTIGSTWANENGFNADAIERQLAHVPGDVRSVYNRAEYLDERRRMLEAWADWLMPE